MHVPDRAQRFGDLMNRRHARWRGAATFAGQFHVQHAGGHDPVFQFLSYTMGESQMGRLSFPSRALFAASIVIPGTLRGVAFGERKDAGSKVEAIVWGGIAMPMIATAVIGYVDRLASMAA